MTSLAYLNGRFVPFADAALPLSDAGFAAGATIVDTARTYRQRLFRWPDHLARFRRDCEACLVPLPTSDAELTAAAERLVAHNAAGGELMLVTFATPGPLGFYTSDADGPPTVGMVTYPLPVERYRRFFTEGVRLAVVGHQPADPAAVLPPTAKHRSRLHWWIADRRPKPPGAVAVLLDRPGGTLTETSIANLLAVIDGVVVSPPRDRILDGISLRVTIELCEQLGLPVAERELPAGDLPKVTEMMLTGTGFGLAGVRRVDEFELPWPGPVFARLRRAWDIVEQMSNSPQCPTNDQDQQG